MKDNTLLIPMILLVLFAFASFIFFSYMKDSNVITGFAIKDTDTPQVEKADPQKVATYGDTVFIVLFIILLVVLLEYKRRKGRKKK